MAATTTSPGVYIEEDASRALAIGSAETAVPVFIGNFVSRGSDSGGGCIRIDSFADYVASFEPSIYVEVEAKQNAPSKAGSKKSSSVSTDALPKDYSYTFKVRNSSRNGYFALRHYFANGGGRCYVLPLASTGAADLAKLPELIEKAGDITLLVCPETDETLAAAAGTQAGSGAGKQAIYSALNVLLTSRSGYFLIADSPDGSEKPSTAPDKTAVYFPSVITPYRAVRLDNDQIVVRGSGDLPDSLTLAELKDVDKTLFDAITAKIDSLYPDHDEASIELPASAAVAGAYCRTDASRGVWKTPANVPLYDVDSLTAHITDVQQGTFNDAGVNAIRSFAGRGVLVWGGRTMVPASTPNWLYIAVRRLFNAAERDIGAAVRSAVFDGNNAPTWERVRKAIEGYLYRLWQQGGLVGVSPSQAYFVDVGKGITMTDEDIKQGRMVVRIGMAAVRPAEFIVLEFVTNVD